MAAFFTDAEIAILRNRARVNYVLLAKLQFKTADPLRIFTGAGYLDTAGEEWIGLGRTVSITGLSDQRGLQSQPVTFTMSGVDPVLLPLAIGDTEEVEQQPIILYMQFLDDDLQPIGRLIQIFAGLMQPPSIDYAEGDDSKGPTATIRLTAENLLIGKSKPPNGRYTDRDQQSMYPGDLFLSYVSQNKSKVVVWPNY